MSLDMTFVNNFVVVKIVSSFSDRNPLVWTEQVPSESRSTKGKDVRGGSGRWGGGGGRRGLR